MAVLIPPATVLRWARPGDAAGAHPLLGSRDSARADRYVQRLDRDRSALSAVLLRTVAAGLTGSDVGPDDITRHCPTCRATDHGRPVLADDPGLWLSSSHAGGVVVAVATRRGPVGLDVEEESAVGFAGFDSVLHPEELAEHDAVAAAARNRWRVRLWTAKEALLKASGEGLRRDPADLRVLDSEADLYDLTDRLPDDLAATHALTLAIHPRPDTSPAAAPCDGMREWRPPSTTC